MSNWREAKSLQTLEKELQSLYPGTTTWEIGDAAHQNSWSDHNPNSKHVVCGKDIKGNAGLNLRRFVDFITKHPHPNLRYVIFNHKIYERKNGFEPETYHGKSGHEEHAHVSVGNGPDGRSTSGYDNTSSWKLSQMDSTTPKPSQPTTPSKPADNTTLGAKMPTLKRGSKGRAVRILQAILGISGWKVSTDGIFGQQTEKAFRAFQEKFKLSVDGICGPKSWNKLLGI
jgi:hypothetical protein